MRRKSFILFFCALFLFFAGLNGQVYADQISVNAYTDEILLEDHKGHIIGDTATFYYGNQMLYSLEDVAKALGYNYIWDRETNGVTINFNGFQNPAMDDEINGFGIDKRVINFDMKVSAKGAIILEDSGDNVVFSKNGTQKLYPASTTKILTALIALEKGNLSDIVTVGESVKDLPGDSRRAFIYTGDKLTLEQLLYGLLLHSGNDCAVAIAEHIGGSVEGFAQMMNERAKEIGAVNSNFVNPHGYHDDNHYTTPKDLAMIMLECCENETFKKIVYAGKYTAKYKNRNNKTVVKTWNNTNRFARDKKNYYLAGIIGGKTGFTTPAGRCLVNATEYGGHTYATAILNDSSDGRYYNTKKLTNKAYDLRAANATENFKDITLDEVKPTISYNTQFINIANPAYIYDNNIYLGYEDIVKIFGNNNSLELEEEVKVYINNDRMVYYKYQPQVEKDMLMLPINELIDDLNLSMTWDEENNQLIIQSGEKVINLPITGNTIIVDGVEHTIQEKVLSGDMLYVSSDFITYCNPSFVLQFTNKPTMKINKNDVSVVSAE